MMGTNQSTISVWTEGKTIYRPVHAEQSVAREFTIETVMNAIPIPIDTSINGKCTGMQNNYEMNATGHRIKSKRKYKMLGVYKTVHYKHILVCTKRWRVIN